MIDVLASQFSYEHHNATTLHPVGAASVVALGLWMFLAPRRNAMLPLLILICFMPSAQRIVIAGLDFTLLRIMVMIGMARVITRGEIKGFKPTKLDVTFVIWAFVGALVYVVQQGDVAASIYSAGRLVDALGAYFVGRLLIRHISDLRAFAYIAAGIGLVVSLFFLNELSTQRNLFAVFGGVREITWVRDGRLRCQGAFAHAILAGVFWAALLPIFIAGVWERRRRTVFIAATFAALLIVGATASSTPLLGVVAAVGFWVWWPFRHYMRWAFIGAPFALTALHIVMEAPVWHLVSRVSAVGGSTGYHRFVLIDASIRRFNEWWLVGTTSTGHWSEHYQTWDITNQYIFEGVRGGVWRLILFCLIILLAGLNLAYAQRRAETTADKALLWGVGGSIFVHCVCFIGVSYFGQIEYLWFVTLAACSSAGVDGFCRTGLRHARTPAARQSRWLTKRAPAPGELDRRLRAATDSQG